MKKNLIEALASLERSVATAIPKITLGLLLVVFGLLIIKLIEVVMRTTLTRIRFDSLVDKAGVHSALRRIGLRQRLSVFLPKLVYYLMLFLLAKTISDALGLTAISDAIAAFFSYLPNVVAAVFLLILGTTIGQFAGQTVTQAAQSSGIDSAPALGKLVSSLIIFIVAMMAISQLKIDTTMVRIVTSFILGAFALAFGLAFGLGTRDVVRNIVTGYYIRKILTVSKNLEIADQAGVLTAVTATHLVLTSEDHEILIANSAFLEQTSRQG